MSRRPAVKARPRRTSAATWGLCLLAGALLAMLGAAWVAVAHTLALPTAWLKAWPGPPAWAYGLYLGGVMVLPLAGLGWAGGALLQHLLPLQRHGWGLRLVTLLPWLLASPWLVLRWSLQAEQPLAALLGQLASGPLLPAWLALPVGLAWATRARRRRKRRASNSF